MAEEAIAASGPVASIWTFPDAAKTALRGYATHGGRAGPWWAAPEHLALNRDPEFRPRQARVARGQRAHQGGCVLDFRPSRDSGATKGASKPPVNLEIGGELGPTRALPALAPAGPRYARTESLPANPSTVLPGAKRDAPQATRKASPRDGASKPWVLSYISISYICVVFSSRPTSLWGRAATTHRHSFRCVPKFAYAGAVRLRPAPRGETRASGRPEALWCIVCV